MFLITGGSCTALCSLMLSVFFVADIDYFPVDTEVVFDLEESSKLISIKLPEDDVFFEANKTFEVYLTATPGVFISPIGFAYATILNDDEPLTGL